MSNIENLKQLGRAAGETVAVLAVIAANGANYLADVKALPALIQAVRDDAQVVANFKADLAEIKGLDEAGRTDLAAAWQADLPDFGDKTIDEVLAEGVMVITYVLEGLGFLLKAVKPAAAA